MTGRFQIEQSDEGQVYISEAGHPALHAEIHGRNDVTIQVGIDGRVEIDKMYGPLVFWSIRVSLDPKACEWIIEREMGPTGEWREWTRIPGQIDGDVTDHAI